MESLHDTRVNRFMQTARTIVASLDGEAVLLDHILESKGQEGVVGRLFVGYDHDYGREMVYRVERYDQNNGHPMLSVSELTVHPWGRVCSGLNLDLHLLDVELSDRRALPEVVKKLGLSTDYFPYYL